MLTLHILIMVNRAPKADHRLVQHQEYYAKGLLVLWFPLSLTLRDKNNRRVYAN